MQDSAIIVTLANVKINNERTSSYNAQSGALLRRWLEVRIPVDAHKIKIHDMIALEDLKGLSEEAVIELLTQEYGEGDGATLENKEVLLAYQSVGSWGCDSSSFFLLKDKTTEQLFEIHGSHCSCFGFEGQLNLEASTKESLQYRDREGGVFYPGGYDNDEVENKKAVSDYIKSL